MSTDADLTHATATDAHDGAHGVAHDDHEAHDVSDKQYVIIALMLAALTAAEVAVSYLDTGSFMIPLLLIMMVIKFFTVVGYFMHLKFDNRLFGAMFYMGLGLAVFLYSAVLATFHFYTG